MEWRGRRNTEVSEWLADNNLIGIAEAVQLAGYEDMIDFRSMVVRNGEEFNEIVFAPGHRAKIKRLLDLHIESLQVSISPVRTRSPIRSIQESEFDLSPTPHLPSPMRSQVMHEARLRRMSHPISPPAAAAFQSVRRPEVMNHTKDINSVFNSRSPVTPVSRPVPQRQSPSSARSNRVTSPLSLNGRADELNLEEYAVTAVRGRSRASASSPLKSAVAASTVKRRELSVRKWEDSPTNLKSVLFKGFPVSKDSSSEEVIFSLAETVSNVVPASFSIGKETFPTSALQNVLLIPHRSQMMLFISSIERPISLQIINKKDYDAAAAGIPFLSAAGRPSFL